MVSMKDISMACGVSVATVSKALNDHKDIGEETKKRIRQIAKEMGYVPNSASKALKTRRTYNIGVLFTDEARSGLTHDYFSYVLDNFKRTVEQQGYDLTFINCCKTRESRMSYLEHARYRGFDGVVIACVDFYDPEVLELVLSDIPVVTIDHLFNNRMAIISDNVKGMKDLLTYVYQKGHRRIAYIHGADSAVTQNRLSSFYRTAEELGLEIPDEYIKEAAYRDTDATFARTMDSKDWLLERIVEEFKEDKDKLRNIRRELEDSLNAKFGELCYECEIYDAEIMRYWARAVYAINGAGSCEKKNSALWIYRRACIEDKMPGYGIWQEWARLEFETNGAGDYKKENSALWIYRKSCIEEKASSYGGWIGWVRLEFETNGAGSYEKENSALWICKKACLEEKVPGYSIWMEWIKIELEMNGAGDYETESSALWICKKACLEEKVPGYSTWLEWVKIEFEVNGAGDYETENSALWICKKACLEEKVPMDGIWLKWTKLELEMNGAGDYETENSTLWIYKKACIEREMKTQGLWLSWARIESDENGIGSYEEEYSALWIYKKACIEIQILDPGLWMSWAKLEMELNGAGSYEIETSALWIYWKACINKNITNSVMWANWAKLEMELNGAGSYETENSALWIYQETYHRGYTLAPAFWLGWAKAVEDYGILDSKWTVKNIYQQALEATKWEINVAMAYVDYLMYQGQFASCREMCRQLFVQEKYQVVHKLLIIETVAGNIDSGSEFSVPQIISKMEDIFAFNPGYIKYLYVYYYIQKDDKLADKYYEMIKLSAEEIRNLERAGEEFMIKCKEIYKGAT